MNVAALASELNICKRSVHRELRALEVAAGVALHFNREEGGYQFPHGFFLPPVNLTLGEALALSMMSSELGRLKQMPLLEQAWQGMLKIRSQLPTSIQDQLVQADKTVKIRTAAASPHDGSSQLLMEISNAITSKRKLRLVYESSAAPKDLRPFLFRPYSLYFGQRAWYVVGHSERAGEERTLKLSRMSEVVTTDFPYGIPDGWSLDKAFGKAWRMVRGKRRYDVAVEFTGEFARTMAETLWHPTQKISWPSADSCLFECEVDGLDEIVWWVLSYGPNATVIKPTLLADRVHELLIAAVQRYQASDKGDPGIRRLLPARPFQNSSAKLPSLV